MTIVKTCCYDCGEVEVKLGVIQLSVCTKRSLSFYRFTCPRCSAEVTKPADDMTINLLVGGGLRAEVWEFPAEADEPHTGQALTYDDLLDFALHLGTTDLLVTADAQILATLAQVQS